KRGGGRSSPTVTTGRLRLSLRRHRYANGIPEAINVRDEPERPIEVQLNGLIAKLRLLVIGADARAERSRVEEIKQAQQRKEGERRAREREAERAKEEMVRKEKFFAEVDLWDRVDRRRQYLDRMERSAHERGADLAEGSPLREWINWARAVCDSDDPLDARLKDFDRL
ncbi:hypothetical protein P0D80_50850, partial [Paraburkholderia sp. RL17-373-BIF-A]